MTLTLDLPPAEEAELRRLATAGDVAAVRAKLADRLDELAAGLAQPVRGDAESPERRAAAFRAGIERMAADFAAACDPAARPLTNEELRRENLYDD